MTEAAFTRDVCDVADSLGLLWHHCPDSRRCKGNRGFPDLVVAGPGGLALAELKSETGEQSAEQQLWHWTLEQASRRGGWCPYVLWQPSMLESGQIERELRQLR